MGDVIGGGGSSSQQQTAVAAAPAITAADMDKRREEAGQYWQNYLGFQQNIEQDRTNAINQINLKTRMGSMAESQATAAIAALDATRDQELEALKAGPTYQLLQEEYAAQNKFAREDWESRAPVTPPDTRTATQIQGTEGFWTQSDTLPTSGVQPKDEQGDIIQYDANGERVPLGAISGGAGNEPDQYEPRADAGHPGMVWVEGGGDAGGYWDTSALDNQGVQWNPDGSIASGKPDYGTYEGGNDPQAAAPQYYWTPGVAPTAGPVTPEDTRDPFTFAGSAEDYFGGLFGNEGPGASGSITQGDAGRRRGGGATSGNQGVGVGQVYSWY